MKQIEFVPSVGVVFQAQSSFLKTVPFNEITGFCFWDEFMGLILYGIINRLEVKESAPKNERFLTRMVLSADPSTKE